MRHRRQTGVAVVGHLAVGRHLGSHVPERDVGQPGRWKVFWVVSIALFMAAVDQSVVATGLPTIDHALGAPINWGGWTITAYQLGQAVAMPIAGRISDQLGRKRVFILSAVVFTAASLLCGMANSIYVLICFRVLQALAGGAFMPSATGIISDVFGDGRDKAIGMFTSVFPLGMLVGPIVGGVIITYGTWREIFFLNVPIGIAFALMAVRVLPTGSRRSVRTDVLGAVLFGLSIASMMLAITEAGNIHPSPFSIGVPALIGLALLATFLTRSISHPMPIIPIRLLWARHYATMNVINLSYGAASLGIGMLVPLFAEDRYGFSSLQAGTLLTARAVGMLLVAALASIMLVRTGYRKPMAVGFGLVSAGLVLMAVEPAAFGAYTWLTAATALSGLGIGMSGPASNNAVLDLSIGDVAAVAGLRGMFRQLGALLAISLTTALVARSGNPGTSLSVTFLAFAAIPLIVLPLIWTVPERRARQAAGTCLVASE